MILSNFKNDNMFITEHSFELPLDYENPDQQSISVFVREIRLDEKVKKPYLVYLQGGPGFESPRPISFSGWIKKSIESL